jgi:hypothetical protein
MSTTDPRTRRIAWWAGLLTGLAAVLVLAAVVAANGERDTAAGVLTGGLLVLALVAVARARAVRNATSAATASRVAGGEPDERDRQVLQRSAATVGLSAFLVAPVSLVVSLAGVDAETVLGALPWVFIAVGVVSFVVVDRRT